MALFWECWLSDTLGLDLAYARLVHRPLALCHSRTLSLKHNPPAFLPVSLSHRSLSLFLSLFLSPSFSFPLSPSFSLCFAFFPPLSPCVKVPLSCARSLARLAPRSHSRFRLRLRSRPCFRSRTCLLCVCLFSALSLSSLSRVLSLFVLFVPSCPFSLSLALTCLDQWFGLQRWCPCARMTGERKNKLTGEKRTPGCPKFECIIHPPRSRHTETLHHPFCLWKNRFEITYTCINIMFMRLYEVYDILRTDTYGSFEYKNIWRLDNCVNEIGFLTSMWNNLRLNELKLHGHACSMFTISTSSIGDDWDARLAHYCPGRKKYLERVYVCRVMYILDLVSILHVVLFVTYYLCIMWYLGKVLNNRFVIVFLHRKRICVHAFHTSHPWGSVKTWKLDPSDRWMG